MRRAQFPYPRSTNASAFTFLLNSGRLPKQDVGPASAIIAVAAVGGGIVLAEVGVGLAVLGSKSAPASVRATAGPGGGGLSVTARF